MSVIGLDIGTTSLCAVLIRNRQPVKIARRANRFLDEALCTQDPKGILALCQELLEQVWEPQVTDIAISCQMHGILFLNGDGQPVSDFYTWKNPWGRFPLGDSTYAGKAADLTGFPARSGHGLVTAFYLKSQGQLPREAAAIGNIGDFVAMALTGAKRPVMNITVAESIGGFCREEMGFSFPVLEKLGLDPCLFPEVTLGDFVYGTYQNARVHAALGDNQCSFLGSVRDPEKSVCVNVGTGQQVSCLGRDPIPAPGVEIRSFFDRGWLYVGVSQNGGKSYERFIRLMESITLAFSGEPVDGYRRAWEIWSRREPGQAPQITPALYGPIGETPRGTVELSRLENLDAAGLIHGFVDGMARELQELYLSIPEPIRREKTDFYGSGNGIVKNRILWELTQSRLGRTLREEENTEAAACGAAFYIEEDNT